MEISAERPQRIPGLEAGLGQWGGGAGSPAEQPFPNSPLAGPYWWRPFQTSTVLAYELQGDV